MCPPGTEKFTAQPELFTQCGVGFGTGFVEMFRFRNVDILLAFTLRDGVKHQYHIAFAGEVGGA